MSKESSERMIFLERSIKLSINTLEKIVEGIIGFRMMITKDFYHAGKSFLNSHSYCYSIFITSLLFGIV